MRKVALALLALFVGAGAAPGPTEPPRARPVGSGNWIGMDDYPADAMRNQQEGVVGVTLFVNEAGRVAACTVTQSSSAATLDAATCALLTRRARFAPQAVAPGAQFAGIFATKVRWTIPVDEDDLCPPTLADANRVVAAHAVLSSSENDRGTITRYYAGGGTKLRAPVQKLETAIIDGQIYSLHFYLPPRTVDHMPVFKAGYAGRKVTCAGSSCWWFENEAHWHDPGVLANVDLQDMITDQWSHLICHYERYPQ